MDSETAKLINLSKLDIEKFKWGKGHSKTNVDLEALKQSVDVTWTEISPVTQSANGITRRVELQYADHQQETSSELGLVQNVKKVQRVTLGGVLVTGLPQPIRLPLSELPPEVRELFGDELIIRDEVTWETESEHEAPEHNSEPQNNGRAKVGSRVAMVTTTESTYKYVVDIIYILDKFQVSRKVNTPEQSSRPSAVTWTLTGECEFQWSSQPDVVWT